MDDLRRTSVYDLTSLRLHPDGLRVRQREKNLGESNYRRTVQDSQRRWIANDAGGSYEAPLWRPRRLPSPSEDREVELEELGDEDGDEEEEEERDASGNRKRKRKRKNTRPTKRKKFMKDDSYLSVPSRNEPLEMPSQDLLKNIHLLAAKYYDERGLLLNASKGYRRAKKMRKLGMFESISPSSPSSPSDQEVLEEDQEPEEQEEREGQEQEGQGEQEGQEPEEQEERVGHIQEVQEEQEEQEDDEEEQDEQEWQEQEQEDEGESASDSQQVVVEHGGLQTKVTRDMYRVLDGSVLLALGVLTQELVKKLIAGKRPRRITRAPPVDEVDAVEDHEAPVEDYEVEEYEEDYESEVSLPSP